MIRLSCTVVLDGLTIWTKNIDFSYTMTLVSIESDRAQNSPQNDMV
jgi:hypothetical protein